MKLSPYQYILFDWGWGRLNGTICFTWLIIVLLAGTARLITRNLSTSATMSNRQNLVEVVVSFISSHIRETIHRDPAPLIPFVGTLFLFIFVANVLAIIPFETEEVAVQLANDTPDGVAAYIQTGDPGRAERVAARLRAGAVHINGGGMEYGSPFGGYKQSGNGREGGMLGIDDYQEVKTLHFG